MQDHIPTFPEGWKVFPLHPGTKRPIHEGWPAVATDDTTQIAAWATDFPGCNWAVAAGPSGLSMVDIDGDTGEDNWFMFETEHGPFPETRTHRTPRGGRHLIFRGDMTNSASKLGDKIDTRGGNGYVVIPPSTFEGKDYECIEDRPIADLPEAIREAAGRSRDHVEAAEGITLDDERQISRGRRLLLDYVERGHVARQNASGDTRTYQVAAELQNLGLSPERALDLMMDIWNPACVPPWDADELRVKIENASRYSQNAAGAWAVTPTEDRIPPDALDMLMATGGGSTTPDAPSVGERASRFAWMGEAEFKDMKPPEWLLDDMLIKRTLAVIFGKSGHFKSFIALGLGCRIAQQGRSVFYVAGEGINRMARLDYPAWKLAHGEFATLPFYMMEDMPEANDEDDYLHFAESIKAKVALTRQNPGLIVLDTLNRAMSGLDENSAKDVSAVLKKADWLRKSFNCTVIIIHHTGDGDPDKMRGSSAIRGYVDTVLKLKREDGTNVVKLWVDKQKNAPERMRPWCFEGKQYGPGLAFVEIDEKAARDIAGDADIFGVKHVGATLAKLGARGEDHKITTHVLARALEERAATHTDESWADALGKMEKGLRAVAKGKASAYAYGEGRNLVWYIPGEPTDEF